MEYLILVHVVVELFINDFFKDLAKGRKYSNWPIILFLQPAVLFVERNYLTILPASGKLVSQNGKANNMRERSINHISSNLHTEMVKFIHTCASAKQD